MPKQVKFLVFTAVGVVTLGAILFFAQPKPGETPRQQDNTASNALETDKLLHDFGTVSMKDGKVNAMFTVTNSEPQAVSLKTLYTSCMCTEAALWIGESKRGPYGMPGHGAVPTFKETLESGQSAVIEVVFDPAAHGPSGVGVIERVVTLETEDGKLINMNIKANVTP